MLSATTDQNWIEFNSLQGLSNNNSNKIKMLEKTLESPLDCKEIQPATLKGNHSWIFTGRTDAKALILWPPDEKNWLTGKDLDAGKDWRQGEKGTTEDEMAGWHHWLDGHWWWTGKPGVLQTMGSQRVEHECVTELKWNTLKTSFLIERIILRNACPCY